MDIKISDITEKLLFNTIRLETTNGIGTGSFFMFKINSIDVPIIITNSHVVSGKTIERVRFILHKTDKQECFGDGKQIIDMETNWFHHPKYDLCFAFAEPILKQLEANKIGVSIYMNNQKDIANDSLLSTLTAYEDVIMIGYPNGLYDCVHNLPLIRSGHTATHPALNFNGL